MRKKIIIVIVSVLILFTVTNLFFGSENFVYANSTSEIEEKLNQNIVSELTELDLSGLDGILSNIDSTFNIFGNGSFKDKISQIVNGEYFVSFESVFVGIVNLLFGNLVNLVPLILTIIALTILSVFVSNFSGNKNTNISEIIHFVCYGVVVVLLVSSFSQIISTTNSTLSVLQKTMEGSFPILLTLLTSIGAVTSVSIYKPIVAILSGGITSIFSKFLFPMFIISFVFIVVGNISSTMKLNKFNDFISSSFKWIMGFVLTIFSSFLVVQGISAGKFDSVSIKATKFAVKSYIPMIGGFISDGFDFILLSSSLIKNAVGVGVLFIVFMTVVVPIVKIVVFKLCLQLLAAVIEPIGNSKITNFINSCAKILTYPIAILVGVAFMFLLVVALIMTTANIF